MVKEKIKFVECRFQRITIGTNDIIVLPYPGRLTSMASEQLREDFKRSFSNNQVEEGMKIRVLRP